MCHACLTRRRVLTLGAASAAATAVSGCDGPPDLVSDETVERLGLESWARIRQSTALSPDRGFAEALAEVANRTLVAVGERPGDWEFRVFAGDTINAFALPGRKVGVYEGMFRITRTADQLAAIVGHEIGHLQAEHGKERISAQRATNWGLRVIAFLLNAGEVEYADEIAAALGLGAEVGLLLPYSRRQELEADRLGLIAMARADYDPEAAVALWQGMERAVRGRAPEVLATHPAPASRIEAIREMIPELTT